MQNFELLDDALYKISKIAPVKAVTGIVQKPKTLVKGSAEQALWEREEETIRKKLEKSSINMMKTKIAQ